MIELLARSPLLLLSVVAAVGYPLGRVQLFGSRLGTSAVLFAGIAIGAIDPSLELPDIVYQLGLVLFVYTVGLASGTGFVSSIRTRGLRDLALTSVVLASAAVAVVFAQRALVIRPAVAGGLFAGALTNTPALAAQIELLTALQHESSRHLALSDPTIGYSIAYPLGVLGAMAALTLARRWWRVDLAADAERARAAGLLQQALEVRVMRVPTKAAGERPATLAARKGWSVVFGRLQRGGTVEVALDDGPLEPGDLLTVVGERASLDRVATVLEPMDDESLALDRRSVDYRRIFVSNPDAAGRPLGDLDLPGRFGAVVTRLRRGDVDLLPHPSTVVELGDRVRVVATREQLERVARFFGDSYRAVSEIDILSFSLGLALGLMLGAVPIPLGTGATLRLGLAGGPLVVALTLGWLERTGPVVWSLPYGANLTIRQVGLVLFLAGVGTRAGYEFLHTVASWEGMRLFATGGAITFSVALLALWIGYRRLGLPFAVVAGMLAGVQTQPALLAFAREHTGGDLPSQGYAAVYPLATVLKIVLGQIVLLWMI